MVNKKKWEKRDDGKRVKDHENQTANESAGRYQWVWLEIAHVGLVCQRLCGICLNFQSHSGLRRERNLKLLVPFVQSLLDSLPSAAVGGEGASMPRFHFSLMDPLSRLLLLQAFHILCFS